MVALLQEKDPENFEAMLVHAKALDFKKAMKSYTELDRMTYEQVLTVRYLARKKKVREDDDFRLAQRENPFGGILSFNRPLEEDVAKEILKNFVEAIVAPGFDEKAVELLASKKNIRLLEMPAIGTARSENRIDFKRIGGGLLVQDLDTATHDPATLKVVTEKQPTEQEMEDLKFAWVIAKHVKSNAIIYARNQETIGMGAGQMSRVDSARLAVDKAQKPLEGSVMASDAFFPFRDSVDAAAKSGVSAIIQPGGSIRDEEVIQAANEHKIAMVFTGIRHFKH